MNRGMRDGGSRSRFGSGDYSSMRNYGSQGGGGYGGQGVLGTSPPGLLGHGMGGGGSGYGMGSGGGGYEMDSLLQQHSLQQKLSLRESQLALANSLLQQQQSHIMDGPGIGMRGGPGPMGMGGGGMMMNKRRPDMRQSDFQYQPDFKRPRNDFRILPRDRYRGRDSDAGNRSFTSRRNQSSSSSRPYRSSDRDASGKVKREIKEEYDPEKPTADDDEKKGDGEKLRGDQRYHCHVCNTNCRDDEGFRRHMNSNRHKDRMLGVLSIHEEKSSQIASRMKAEKHLRHVEDEDKISRGYCKICDVALPIRFSDHQRLTFHRKRVMQVTKGCGWCGVTAFKNFTEVLAHRETEQHKKNQESHEKRDSRSRSDSEHRGVKSEPPVKKRVPIRVEMPANLVKYDPEVAVGQSTIIPVTGFFCKLCNKFYNNEAAAKETHCKTETHFGKYKRFVYAKLRAKAEAERDAAEKAAEEEEKKKKEDAEAKGEGDAEKDKNGTAEQDSSLDESKAEHADDDEDAMDEGGEEGKKGETEEEVEAEEDGHEEGGAGEEDDNEILAADGTALDFDDEDVEEENLLNETENNSAYQTAEDEALGMDSTVETLDAGDQTGDASGISILAGENTSELLQDSSQAEQDSMATDDPKEDDGEGEMEVAQDEEEEAELGQKRATRATASPRSTSTPSRGRGRGGGTNKARRGRKVSK